MTTLRVILDEVLDGGSVGRYTEELTREIIRIAPRGCYVEGFVSASTETDYADLIERVPGLEVLHKSPLARRELRAAWQHGFTRLPGSGMVHATSPLAPLARHDRLNDGDQIVVTFHEALAWTEPQSLTTRGAAWARAMAKRTEKYADAVVVPSHVVADELEEGVGFGDRIRVISGAPSSTLILGSDADQRASLLGLPSRYVLATTTVDPAGLNFLVETAKRLDVPLLIIGTTDTDLASLVTEHSLPTDRVRGLGDLSDADRAVVLARAAAWVQPDRLIDYGMPVLDAFAFGVPLVHADHPTLVELAAGSGLAVTREGAGYPDRLAEALRSVLGDSELASRLALLGRDRAQAYSWRSSAEKIWQLHADL